MRGSPHSGPRHAVDCADDHAAHFVAGRVLHAAGEFNDRGGREGRNGEVELAWVGEDFGAIYVERGFADARAAFVVLVFLSWHVPRKTFAAQCA